MHYAKMRYSLLIISFLTLLFAFRKTVHHEFQGVPKAVLIPSKKFVFNSFVDCNMAEVWVGDTLRIFPGKYGEDPLWGNARDLKYADGKNCASDRKAQFMYPAFAQYQADDRHDDGIGKGCYNFTKCSSNNYSNGQINDIALHGKGFEFL